MIKIVNLLRKLFRIFVFVLFIVLVVIKLVIKYLPDYFSNKTYPTRYQRNIPPEVKRTLIKKLDNINIDFNNNIKERYSQYKNNIEKIKIELEKVDRNTLKVYKEICSLSFILKLVKLGIKDFFKHTNNMEILLNKKSSPVRDSYLRIEKMLEKEYNKLYIDISRYYTKYNIALENSIEKILTPKKEDTNTIKEDIRNIIEGSKKTIRPDLYKAITIGTILPEITQFYKILKKKIKENIPKIIKKAMQKAGISVVDGPLPVGDIISVIILIVDIKCIYDIYNDIKRLPDTTVEKLHKKMINKINLLLKKGDKIYNLYKNNSYLILRKIKTQINIEKI